MVETDFWPNFMYALQQGKVKAILVNGRISDRSLKKYLLFRRFFSCLFRVFEMAAMQTAGDRDKMISLGLSPERITTLGNLKYDLALSGPLRESEQEGRPAYGIGLDRFVLVAASTHAGEEEVVFDAYMRLLDNFPDIFLVVAPRNIERGEEIRRLAKEKGLKPFKRTAGKEKNANVLVLDTLGELIKLYALVDLVFVGGSLVPEGGHNPLEPACFGKPVLFGPHMEDFPEISNDMLAAGAALQVDCGEDLLRLTTKLFTEDSLREKMATASIQLINKNKGVTERHLELIRSVLENMVP